MSDLDTVTNGDLCKELLSRCKNRDDAAIVVGLVHPDHEGAKFQLMYAGSMMCCMGLCESLGAELGAIIQSARQAYLCECEECIEKRRLLEEGEQDDGQ